MNSNSNKYRSTQITTRLDAKEEEQDGAGKLPNLMEKLAQSDGEALR